MEKRLHRCCCSRSLSHGRELTRHTDKSLSPPDGGDKINWETIDKPVKSISTQDTESTSLHAKT